MAIEVPDWYRTVALVGVDITGEPVVVLLDSTGAIMAVMKGEYAGTLKNIAVDASGRVIMIPTDPADVWGNAISMGNAELAARLGFPSYFHRSGNVIFQDSFANGLKAWVTSTSGAGASVSISSTARRTGGLSCLLIPGSTASKNAEIEHRFPYPLLSKSGLEISYAFGYIISYFLILFQLYDGTNVYDAELKFDMTNLKVQYLDSANVFQDLFTLTGVPTAIDLFHTTKLVIDWSTKKYVKVYHDGNSAIPATTAIRTGLSGSGPFLLVSMIVYADTDTNPDMYVDDVIVTVNEP